MWVSPNTDLNMPKIGRKWFANSISEIILFLKTNIVLETGLQINPIPGEISKKAPI